MKQNFTEGNKSREIWIVLGRKVAIWCSILTPWSTNAKAGTKFFQLKPRVRVRGNSKSVKMARRAQTDIWQIQPKELKSIPLERREKDKNANNICSPARSVKKWMKSGRKFEEKDWINAPGWGKIESGNWNLFHCNKCCRIENVEQQTLYELRMQQSLQHSQDPQIEAERSAFGAEQFE